MIRIRLRRVGAKKQPSYRVVVADSRSPRDGRFIERLGWYNPRTDPPSFAIREERALYWLSVGAQPTDAVTRLLKKMGTVEKFERVKAGISIDEILTQVTEVKISEPEINELLPTEVEMATEESAAQVKKTEEADEAFEETGGEEEDETAA